jgi:hypothetical protein
MRRGPLHRHPQMALQKRWIFWQVVVPLIGPAVISAVFILLWMTGNPGFKPSVPVIMDVSPWALVFYTLTLLGATLNELWPNVSKHQTLGGSMGVTAVAVGVYAAFIVIWRHNAGWQPGGPVYVVTGVLLVVSIFLSHAGYAARGRN